MKRSVILFILLFLGFGTLNAQESFTYVIGTESSESIVSTIQTDEYVYAIGLQYPSAYICRFSNENDLIERVIHKPDTMCVMWYGIGKDNGNILTIGKIVVQGKYYLYSCMFSDDLDIIEEKYLDIVPAGYDKLYLYDMAQDENGDIVFAGHLENPEPGTIK